VVLLGDAAHVVHPLAGQGFNLTLRDASLLADVLYETRQLGLALGDGAMLATYETTRRADAKLTAAATHGLANLFSSPLTKLARLGMAITGQSVSRDTRLREQMNAQANSGLSVTEQGLPLARLMRGERFDD
jgi:2-octaprenyl-6-methoxyphenol hydroxylase